MTTQEAINTVYGLDPGQAVVIRDNHGLIDVATKKPAPQPAPKNYREADGTNSGVPIEPGERALLAKSSVELHFARIRGDGGLIGDVLSPAMSLDDAIAAAKAMATTEGRRDV
jgi:hypothetical protein